MIFQKMVLVGLLLILAVLKDRFAGSLSQALIAKIAAYRVMVANHLARSEMAGDPSIDADNWS